MTSKTLGAFLFSFVLGVVLFAAAPRAVRAQDDRAADREAIRAHIDSIFQAFIKKTPRRCARRTRRTGSAIWITRVGC